MQGLLPPLLMVLKIKMIVPPLLGTQEATLTSAATTIVPQAPQGSREPCLSNTEQYLKP